MTTKRILRRKTSIEAAEIRPIPSPQKTKMTRRTPRPKSTQRTLKRMTKEVRRLLLNLPMTALALVTAKSNKSNKSNISPCRPQRSKPVEKRHQNLGTIRDKSQRKMLKLRRKHLARRTMRMTTIKRSRMLIKRRSRKLAMRKHPSAPKVSSTRLASVRTRPPGSLKPVECL